MVKNTDFISAHRGGRCAAIATTSCMAKERAVDQVSPLPTSDAHLEKILRLVYERQGIDLRAYRRTTIERRLASRLQKLGLQDSGEYLDYLTNHAGEAHHLVEHMIIKVSRFFRNAEVFARLAEKILPELAELAWHRNPARELRIWSAGCAKGEEVYSLAILTTEMASVGGLSTPAVIYGTDIEEDACAGAQRGLYAQDALAEVPPDLIAKYFIPHPGRFGTEWEIVSTLRANVRFARHDLLSGPWTPGNLQFDLVLCRNVLIYFERAAQERVFQSLADSLAPGGYLCLGEAEQLSTVQQPYFETIDRRTGLYRRIRQKGGEANATA